MARNGLQRDGDAMKSAAAQGRVGHALVGQGRQAEMEELDRLGEEAYFSWRGLRFVKPYFNEFRAFAKGRWLGKTLIQLMLDEFPFQREEYYRSAIASGDLRVNGEERSDPEHVMRNSDMLMHRMHRHETPVLDEPLLVLYEDEDKVVLSKPASVPVHPCGTFKRNTVVTRMRIEFGLANLYVIHRLDRLTSGVLMLAKTKEAAARMQAMFPAGTVQKVYLARVRGRFPPTLFDAVLERGGAGVRVVRRTGDPMVSVRTFLRPQDQHLGVHEVVVGQAGASEEPQPRRQSGDEPLDPQDAPGKESLTFVDLLYYDEEAHESVVLCFPVTGRTHQIRLHLQHLGFPIVNDPDYGFLKGTEEETRKRQQQRAMRMRKAGDGAPAGPGDKEEEEEEEGAGCPAAKRACSEGGQPMTTTVAGREGDSAGAADVVHGAKDEMLTGGEALESLLQAEAEAGVVPCQTCPECKSGVRRYEVAESSGGHSFEAPPPERWVHSSAVGLLGELHHERHAHVLELRREVSQRITREQAELDQADRAERRRRKHEKRQGKKVN